MGRRERDKENNLAHGWTLGTDEAWSAQNLPHDPSSPQHHAHTLALYGVKSMKTTLDLFAFISPSASGRGGVGGRLERREGGVGWAGRGNHTLS